LQKYNDFLITDIIKHTFTAFRLLQGTITVVLKINAERNFFGCLIQANFAQTLMQRID
jgi:hypothetical protein